MSIVINLLGGPGSSKSTTAAGIFNIMKQENKSIELVQEYVKTWAWEGKAPSSFIDQLYITSKQMRKETLLYKKTDYIVTDSPVILGDVYTELIGSTSLNNIIYEYIKYSYNHNIKHKYFILKRAKEYNTDGRFQTYEQALMLDKLVINKIMDLIRMQFIDKTDVFYIEGDLKTYPDQIINIINKF